MARTLDQISKKDGAQLRPAIDFVRWLADEWRASRPEKPEREAAGIEPITDGFSLGVSPLRTTADRRGCLRVTCSAVELAAHPIVGQSPTRGGRFYRPVQHRSTPRVLPAAPVRREQERFDPAHLRQGGRAVRRVRPAPGMPPDVGAIRREHIEAFLIDLMQEGDLMRLAGWPGRESAVGAVVYLGGRARLRPARMPLTPAG